MYLIRVQQLCVSLTWGFSASQCLTFHERNWPCSIYTYNIYNSAHYIILNCNFEKCYNNILMPVEFIFLILLQILTLYFFLFLFSPSCPPPVHSPGTWASLVPFQVSNRTPILPANVQNYSLNIIGEPFLQAETSNWEKMKYNTRLRNKKKKRRRGRLDKTKTDEKGERKETEEKKIIDQQLQHLQSLIPLRLKL